MTTKTLNKDALAVVEDYLHCHIAGHDIAIPYFNNRRQHTRAGLRVNVGKGSPDDIREEVALSAKKEHVALDNFDNASLRNFLIDHNIGVDCSGFAYHVLDAMVATEHPRKQLKDVITFPSKNPLRRLIAKLRPAENTNVALLASSQNSLEVALSDVAPGDFIVMQKSPDFGAPDHVVLIHAVEYTDDNIPQKLYYTHSLQWKKDTASTHGVRQGTITVTSSTEPVHKQTWTEQGVTGDANETHQRAVQAKYVSIRRLKNV